MKNSVLQKLNREIAEAKNFSGWLKLVVFSTLLTIIILSICDTLAPNLKDNLIWPIFGLPSGYICYVLAKSKKETGWLWFVLGLIFNWVAITIIFIMSENKEKDPKNEEH